jgi:hypothetical protein
MAVAFFPIFFASFSLDLPGGIGRATNEVGFHWASKENEGIKGNSWYSMETI